MLMLSLLIVLAPAVLAVCVTAQLTKSGPSYPVRTPENTVAGDYLDVPKGIMTGTLWGVVMWSALFAAATAYL